MKRTKFLLTIPSVAFATAIPFTSSCSKPERTIEDIEDFIFNPVATQQTPEKDSFVEQLKSISVEEQQKEIFYALYSPIVKWEIDSGKTIKDWYNDNAITLVANINKCSMSFNGDKVIINFIGYVNFIFIKDYEQHHKNDLVQVTFLMDECDKARVDGWGLYFPNWGSESLPIVYGFLEAVQDGRRSLPVAISEMYPQNPKNWHNWNK